jgi:hypothetical protein
MTDSRCCDKFCGSELRENTSKIFHAMGIKTVQAGYLKTRNIKEEDIEKDPFRYVKGRRRVNAFYAF